MLIEDHFIKSIFLQKGDCRTQFLLSFMFVILNIQNQNGSKLMRKFESDVLLCWLYCDELKMKNMVLEKEKSQRWTETVAKNNKKEVWEHIRKCHIELVTFSRNSHADRTKNKWQIQIKLKRMQNRKTEILEYKCNYTSYININVYTQFS